MEFKYVVVQAVHRDDNTFHEVPMMFPCIITHKDMFERTQRAFHENNLRPMKVVGAGFCALDRAYDGGIVCYGRSESLGVASRGTEDESAFARCTKSQISTRIAQ